MLVDLDRVMDTVADETFPYYHREEGPDDMPAHVKSSLFGCSLTIPIHEGPAQLGHLARDLSLRASAARRTAANRVDDAGGRIKLKYEV